MVMDSGSVSFTDFGEGYHESKRCSRDTYPESYITKYTNIRRVKSQTVYEGKQHTIITSDSSHTWTLAQDRLWWEPCARSQGTRRREIFGCGSMLCHTSHQ